MFDRDKLSNHIQDQLKEEIEEIVAEEAKRAAIQVKKRINEMTDKIVLNMLRTYEVSQHGDRIIIQVKKLPEKD